MGKEVFKCFRTNLIHMVKHFVKVYYTKYVTAGVASSAHVTSSIEPGSDAVEITENEQVHLK